jgi:hypothetical protein
MATKGEVMLFKTGDKFYLRMEDGSLRKFVRGANKRWTWKRSKATISDSDVRITLANRVSFLSHVNDNIIEGRFR